MRIDFFEEYPTAENMVPARDISWPSTIYVATPSLEKYVDASTTLASINPLIESAYWPTLKYSYWISPFADTADLFQLRRELREYNGPRLKVLLDLELPLLRKILFLKNAPYFFGNKRIIASILSMHDTFDFAVAEYPAPSAFLEKVKRHLGLSFDSSAYKHTRIPMYYTSMIRAYDPYIPGNALALMRNNLMHLSREEKLRTVVGLGVLAHGALGNEALLSPEQLREDLLFVRDNGFARCVIYRLGGLNDAYLRVIKEFV
ncbi:MAG TPA: hypothetical protein VI483_03920 [Candidatus Paceibacterota bacterium]